MFRPYGTIKNAITHVVLPKKENIHGFENDKAVSGRRKKWE
jgi:hypothetical protein